MTGENVPCLRDHRINGVAAFADGNMDALFQRLSQAHAVLAVIEAAIDSPVDSDFGLLNHNIQREAIGAVQHLVALADWHANEVMRTGS